MSGTQGAWNHFKHGEILTALHDGVTWLKNRIASLPLWTQRYLDKAGTDEYNILKSLIPVGVKDILTGGLSTASFVKAGKDIFAQLVQQNISTFNMQDVMGELNLAVSAQPSVEATAAAVVEAAPPSNVASATTAPVNPTVDPTSPFAVPPAAPIAAEVPPVEVAPVLPDNVAAHAATPIGQL